MSEIENEPLLAADAIGRISEELYSICSDLQHVEKVLFPQLIKTDIAAPGSRELAELQKFDLIMQSVSGIAEILGEFSSTLHHDPHADVSHLIRRTKLASLTARLLNIEFSKQVNSVELLS